MIDDTEAMVLHKVAIATEIDTIGTTGIITSLWGSLRAFPRSVCVSSRQAETWKYALCADRPARSEFKRDRERNQHDESDSLEYYAPHIDHFHLTTIHLVGGLVYVLPVQCSLVYETPNYAYSAHYFCYRN